MGSFKKEANRKQRDGKGPGLGNVKVKGENFYTNAKQAKQKKIITGGKAQRNADGEITKAAVYQSRETPSARVEPNRKWFTNTRVISQNSLQSFRDAVAAQASDPYSYLLKQNKLPMSLIRDDETKKNGIKQHKAKMLVGTQSFESTFGAKAQRKRVKLGVSSLEDLAAESGKSHETYLERLEQQKLLSGQASQTGFEDSAQPGETGELTSAVEPVFSKGQSKRIWNELYKVIDSSDVVIHVLDARDPLGTRCRSVEKYIREEAPHKHLLFVLNKCDLVPTKVAASWVRLLSQEYPTLAFHANINNSFGKGTLISLLRQFSALHTNRKQISVGFIGYPNTGKSSIINTLRKKKVCTVAPIPGETKVWQYITLMKRIYLIDCPGVVPPSMGTTPEDILLRGVVRVENVEHPAQYVQAVLDKCQQRHLERTYEIRGWKDSTDFLEMLARKGGRLLKGGEADLDGVAKMVLNDFLRGKIPWFTAPPVADGQGGVGVEGREGALGEMPSKKRKRDVADQGEGADGAAVDEEVEDAEGSEDDDEFEGFQDEAEVEDGSDKDDDAEESESSLGGLEYDSGDEVDSAELGDAVDGDEGDDDEGPAEDAKTLVAEESDDDDDAEAVIAALREIKKAKGKAKK